MFEDRVIISDLLIRGILGVNPWERHTPRDILVNLELVTDVSAVGASDDIADGVNYRTVAKRVIALVESSSRLTVEALASDVARACLEDPLISRVRVRVDKPGAIRFSRTVGVEIERSRDDLA